MLGAPSPDAPSPGAPSPGAPSPGAPSPGAPSPGAPSPGAPSPGAPSPGAPSPGSGASAGVSVTEADVADLGRRLDELRTAIGRTIIGQSAIVERLLVALLAGGHVLLEGVPGLAKTLMVRSLGAALDLDFKRVQFTPDLMPSDILGTELLEEDHGTGKRAFRFSRGPVFTNLLLADEINRSPPKTQSALLEAMQEARVSVAGSSHQLRRPFFVLATQNPIEQAGTYPLPEAQLDRFLLHLRIDYPEPDDELRILATTTGSELPAPTPVLSAAEVLAAQAITRQVHVAPALLTWVRDLVVATRPAMSKVEAVRRNVEWGAGPRAGQSLILAAKALALLDGRLAVTDNDLRRLLPEVLRHRILLNFEAQARRLDVDDLARAVVAETAPPTSPLT